MGRDSTVGGRSRNRIPVGGARFSASVQADPGAHSASYTMRAGSFLEVKRPERGVNHSPPSRTEVKEKIYNCTRTPLLCLHGRLQCEFTFNF